MELYVYVYIWMKLCAMNMCYGLYMCYELYIYVCDVKYHKINKIVTIWALCRLPADAKGLCHYAADGKGATWHPTVQPGAEAAGPYMLFVMCYPALSYGTEPEGCKRQRI